MFTFPQQPESMFLDPVSTNVELDRNGTSKSHMHILWIKSDFIDPPDTGGKLRTYNLLLELNKRCRVTYVALQDIRNSAKGVMPIKWASRVITFPRLEEKKSGLRFALRVFAAMFSSEPYIVQKYRTKEILECQRRLLSSTSASESVDRDMVLVCDFLEMTGNIDWRFPCRRVLFQHNVESVIWRRYFENERNLLKKAYFWFEHRRLKRYERQACNRFDLVLTVSPRDKEVLQKQIGVTVPIEVIETGVDTSFFAPRPEVEPTAGRLLFLGSLDWMPNIDGIEWFVKTIYPRVKVRCPYVTLDIVGRRPAASVQTMASKDDSINVYGSVPDVRPFMARADLFVVPLRIGSGTRLKIFEAMAMRLPIVSTTVGAEGLNLDHGRHLISADNPDDFVTAVISLLENPDRKHEVARTGNELVTRNCSWKSVCAELHNACLNLIQSDSQPACSI